MEDRSEVWGRKLARLQENVELARSGADVSRLSELSLDELIELKTYSNHLGESVKEVIVTALRLKETESTPAALSAATAVAALNVSNRSLEINEAAFRNAVKQRLWSIGLGITALILSGAALIGTTYVAFFKVAEVSDVQEARMKANIINELRSGDYHSTMPSKRPAENKSDFDRNPFVPDRH